MTVLSLLNTDSHAEPVIQQANLERIDHIFDPQGIDDIALITMVKNESDIIFENLVWHFCLGFRKFVVVDNMSTDNTKKIVEKFAKLTGNYAKVFIIEDPIFEHIQSRIVTGSYDFARSVWPEIKWYFPVDADEFWIAKQGLRKVLATVTQDVDAIKVLGTRYYASNDYKGFDQKAKFYEKIHYRTNKMPPNEKPQLPKIAVRSLSNIKINQGNHSAERLHNCSQGSTNTDNIRYIDGKDVGLDMYEYPIRSEKQVHSKLLNGMKANAKAKELGIVPEGTGVHWDDYARYLKNHGTKAAEIKFNETFISPADSINDPLPIGAALKLFEELISNHKNS